MRRANWKRRPPRVRHRRRCWTHTRSPLTREGQPMRHSVRQYLRQAQADSGDRRRSFPFGDRDSRPLALPSTSLTRRPWAPGPGDHRRLQVRGRAMAGNERERPESCSPARLPLPRRAGPGGLHGLARRVLCDRRRQMSAAAAPSITTWRAPGRGRDLGPPQPSRPHGCLIGSGRVATSVRRCEAVESASNSEFDDVATLVIECEQVANRLGVLKRAGLAQAQRGLVEKLGDQGPGQRVE